jgi:hypothetical protein
MPYNLDSPNALLELCDLSNLRSWFTRECAQVKDVQVRSILERVADNLESFVQWPGRALLLLKGCTRVALEGKRQRYHKYPRGVTELAKSRGVPLDTRANGPAISAYLIAGGHRPPRFGSRNAWSIHHLYSGKFRYYGRDKDTAHATKLPNHFTQSAGLVAMHPIADAMGDEFPFFAWMLRAMAFLRFGYDPDGVFSECQDDLGFAAGYKCEIVCAEQPG